MHEAFAYGQLLRYKTDFKPLYNGVLCLLLQSPYHPELVSSDYFKKSVAHLRSLVGCRFRHYETGLNRARREAILCIN